MSTGYQSTMAPRIRRKPLATYKSPTADDLAFTPKLPTYSKQSSTTSKSSSKSSRSIQSSKYSSTRPKVRSMPPKSPPLPLFHPLGTLAMSLPPLDPTLYGLPVLAIPDEIEERQTGTSKRPTPKNREVEEEVVVPTVSTIAAVAAREAKERASPKKRRVGGAKRKRKDVDDGDATYPAKRTRLPRGASNQNAADEEPTIDIVPPPPSELPADILSDLVEKRRSTRSRGGVKRRDSSESATTSISVTVQQGVPAASAAEQPGADAVEGNGDSKDDEKEEGELSEGQA